MTGEKRSKSTFLETIAVLAIPAVIYLMGYVYWDKYFSCFGIELVKVNLPVYKVMIGATPGVYVVVLAGLLVYFVGRSITRNSAGYDVPTTVLGFIVAVLVIASTLALKRQPKPSWWEPTIYGATCFVGLVAIAWTLDHFTIVKKASIRKFVKRVLTLRIPGLLG
jgi:predicted membrane protein